MRPHGTYLRPCESCDLPKTFWDLSTASRRLQMNPKTARDVTLVPYKLETPFHLHEAQGCFPKASCHLPRTISFLRPQRSCKRLKIDYDTSVKAPYEFHEPYINPLKLQWLNSHQVTNRGFQMTTLGPQVTFLNSPLSCLRPRAIVQCLAWGPMWSPLDPLDPLDPLHEGQSDLLKAQRPLKAL